ncbi:MAG: NfeD family protein [Brevinematia bacterium]
MEVEVANAVTNVVTNVGVTNNSGVFQVIGTPGLEYWIWASIGTLCFVLEIVVPGFIFFWLGLSAIFVSVLTLFLLKTLELQLLAWLVLSAVFVMGFLYYRKRMLLKKPQDRDPVFRYIGMKGEVIQPIVGGKMGKVRLDIPINGITDWNAISQNPNESIGVGERVEVVEVEGIKLIVRKV